MSEQVGEGHIDIDVRLDERNFVSMSRATAKRAAENFGDTYAESVQRSLRKADSQFDSHINRQISSFQALEKQRVAAAEDTSRRLQVIQTRIAQQTVNDRRLSDAYEKEGQRAAANFEREQMASFNRITKAYSAGLSKMADDDRTTTVRMLTQKERDVDHHGRRTGDIFSQHLFHAFEGAMSLLPSRLESLFTRTGPFLGTVLMTSLVTGMSVAIPALGAMLGGLFIASLGLGAAIGAALVGAVDDARVVDATRRLRERFVNGVIYHPDMLNLGAVLAHQLDRVTEALERWVPHINSILQAGARFLDPITTGLIGLVDAVLPALDRLVNSRFMKDIIDIFGGGMIKIGQAFGESFDRILADPKAVEGMKRGLEDIFDLTAGAVKLIFDLIRSLARTWEDMNTDPDGPGPRVSTINTMRDAWKQLRDVLGEVGLLFKEIAKLGTLMDSLFGSDPSGGSGGNGEKPETRLENFTARMRELNAVLEKGKEIWQWYKDNLPAIMATIRGLIDDWQTNVITRWNEAWNNFRNAPKEAWEWIIRTSVQHMVLIEALLETWGLGIKTRWNEVWGNLTVAAVMYWVLLEGLLEAWLAGIKTRWEESWGGMKTFFGDTWDNITRTAVLWASVIFALIDQWLLAVQMRWNEAWEAMKQFFIDRFEDIKTAAGNALGLLAGIIDTSLRAIATGWNAWWGGMWSSMVAIWTNIAGSVQGGMNNVIDLINKGIELINGLLTKLGVSFQISPIGHVGGVVTPQPLPGMGNFSRMATGGRVTGPGTGTSDSVPILASNGEFIINAKQTKRYFGLLSAINSGMAPRFADGGYVSMFKWIKDRVPGVSLASGFRAGDPGYHGRGMAVDLIFSDGSERRGGGLAALAFNMIKSAFMPIIAELIWDFAGGNAVWNGKNHFFTGSGAGPGTHDDHIHWAQGGGSGGGILSGLFEWLGKGWNALVSELIEPMKGKVLELFPQNNGLMSLGHGFAKTILDQAIAKIKVEFDEAQKLLDSMSATAGDQSGGGMAGALKWSGTATQALKMLGLPLSWLGPLLTLIGRESGGNPNAINRWDSNAAKGQPSQGLMQTIPSTFNAHKFPGFNNILGPLDNILAGLRYIVATYGTIFNVRQANSMMSPAGYAKGGVWHPGELGINETRKPEAILTQSQWAAMANGGGGDTYVYIDGVEVAHKAVVEKNNKDLSQALKRGRSVF